MRINEVPVRWVEDADSRVNIAKTATDDLKGIGRLWLDRRRRSSERAHRGSHGLPRTGVSPIAQEENRAADFDDHAMHYEESVDRSVSFTGRDSAFFAAP